MIWALSRGAATDACGYCGHPHEDGDVFALVSAKALARCVVCVGVEPSAEDIHALQMERVEALREHEAQQALIRDDRAQQNHDFERVHAYAQRARKTLRPFHQLPASLRRRHNQQVGNQ